MCRAIPEKGTYEFEEFDRTPIPGTHPGNCLKKFVKREGFYKPVQEEEEEEGSKAEEGEAGEAEEGEDVGIEDSVLRSEPESKGFEIVLPQLTAGQQQEYVQYKEDNKGNIL